MSDPLQNTNTLTIQIETIKNILVLLNENSILKIPQWIQSLSFYKLKNIMQKENLFLNSKEIILNTQTVNKDGKNKNLKDVMHYFPIFETVGMVLKSDKNSFKNLLKDKNELSSKSCKFQSTL